MLQRSSVTGSSRLGPVPSCRVVRGQPGTSARPMRARATAGWIPSMRSTTSKRDVELALFVDGKPRRSHRSSYLPVITNAADAAAADAGDAPQQAASLRPVLLAVVVASMGAFAFGYHLAVLNGPLQAISADLGFAGKPALEGLVVSTCLAGAAIGSTIGAGLAEKFGRKGTLMLDVIPLLAGALIGASATSLNAMIAGRLLIGVGIGLASALVPTYISEIAPTEVRGALGSVNQLVICLGILGALLVNVVFPPAAWRTMFYLSALPAILLGLGLTLVPESPRWQLSKGMQVEAAEGAVLLWGPTGPSQLTEGKSASGGGEGPSLAKLLTTKSVVLGALIFVFQQFAGINAIIYFSSSVFAQAGIQSQALASAGVGAINVAGTVIAGSLVDKAGRKQLLIASYLGMAASMVTMAAGLAMPQLAGMSGTIALVGTLAYVLCFAFGVGPVPGVLVSEINPGNIRGAAVSVAMTVHWICNFAVGQLFLSAVGLFGISGVYMGFAAVCIVAALFVSTCIIETKGRSLEEIERAMA